MVRKPEFSDQIRAAVRASELSRYRICQETGIDQASMSRFMASKGGLSLDSLDRLAAVLDLRIEVGRAPRRKAR